MWSVAPSYSPVSDLNVSGVMRGTITYVRIGDYFLNTPSIINNINITPINDMGWDIDRDANGNRPFINLESSTSYNSVGQLPKGIKVQLDFTPIHNFVPQLGEAFIGNKAMYGGLLAPGSGLDF
jgi:hypothetical protein